ncbi:hypothetical protein ACIHEJ_39180 [Streptomyces sp. NPDC052301]|uniref:hypothetical protein n=1 Tax=Streptomyces sp. NPDC052301 TaxID=3365687 RepID=UPI0037D3F835
MHLTGWRGYERKVFCPALEASSDYPTVDYGAVDDGGLKEEYKRLGLEKQSQYIAEAFAAWWKRDETATIQVYDRRGEYAAGTSCIQPDTVKHEGACPLLVCQSVGLQAPAEGPAVDCEPGEEGVGLGDVPADIGGVRTSQRSGDGLRPRTPQVDAGWRTGAGAVGHAAHAERKRYSPAASLRQGASREHVASWMSGRRAPSNGLVYASSANIRSRKRPGWLTNARVKATGSACS